MSRRVEIDGKPRVLHFGISGKLYNSNLLLYDVETYSLWSQFVSSAVSGPLAGSPHELLPSERLAVPLSEQEVGHTVWKDWRSKHPDTLVLAREGQEFPGGAERDYDRDPYSRVPRRAGGQVVGTYDYNKEGTPLMFEPRERPEDSPIGDKARVIGINFGDGHYKAYPLKALKRAGGSITDTVNGRTVVVRYENDYSASAVTPEGKPVRAIPTYWFAWYAFHPATELYWPSKKAR